MEEVGGGGLTQKEDVFRHSYILRSSPQLISILMIFFIIKEEDSGRGWREEREVYNLKGLWMRSINYKKNNFPSPALPL